MSTTRQTIGLSKMSNQAFSCCNTNEEFQRSIDFGEKEKAKQSSNVDGGALTGYRRRIHYEMETASSSGCGIGKENRQHDTLSVQSSTSSLRSLRVNASRTFQSFRTTIDTLSQKLRRSTRRRYRLEAQSGTTRGDSFDTPSPVRMYSPFRIETPAKRRSGTAATGMGTPGRYTPRRRMAAFKSPGNNLRREVEALRLGTAQLNDLAHSIVVRRSMRR